MEKEFVKALRSISAMLLFAVPFHVSAQTSITHECNGIRLGDRVEKQQMEYTNPGDSGEEKVWDFSEVRTVGTNASEFFCDSDSVVICELEPTRINKYSFRTDSLLLVGYETPLTKVDYSYPINVFAYPFSYGQSFTAPYYGKGKYCKTNAVELEGVTDVEADGTGTLILSESDTLRNAIRVHSIRTGSVAMHLEGDTTAVARSRMKQEIEERYQWYARGYRYPLFETVSTSYYDDMELVSCIQTAYLYSPDKQHLLTDELNESVQRADSLEEHSQTASDIIDYSVTLNGNTVSIDYSLTESATITALLCNHRGMTYRRTTTSNPAGEHYEMTLNCSGLEPDVYILYINVNGKVYNEKIILK